jgi:hypothetical protein
MRNLVPPKHGMARRAMGHVWHGMSQWVVLGPPLQPIGCHGPAYEAGGPLWHDGQHDPLVARPLRAWPIQPGILLWSCIKYYCGHVSSIQILWSSYFVGSNIPVKIKYLPAFLSMGCSWHGRPNGHGSTVGQMGRHGRHMGQHGMTQFTGLLLILYTMK